MMSIADFPDSLALFPLPGAILLPRAKLPLHIFEPRYLQMIEDSLKTSGRLIGMIQPVTGASDGRLHRIGCAGRLTQFSETDDGRYMITLTGICRFRVGAEIEGFTPYRKFNVDWSDYAGDARMPSSSPTFETDHVMDLLARYLEARGLSTEWGQLQEAGPELLVNTLSMLLDFDVEDKQALLEASCLATRHETLVTLLEFALRGGALEEKLQ